ncbi:Alpha/Beta hydrolase protein [Halteromyces radiatus]|uniref:Alpha/Beta hydrolase protein n=1 Tax=Halteromyces radiatus TaxID=101107 RepID=UPI00221EB1A4|nr:Alpha/Beta hydrolase protein [Halteromyces radiatus]KAI8088946.1 Alpha/Beta hydrolase protein [Halteromyces radiatus]
MKLWYTIFIFIFYFILNAKAQTPVVLWHGMGDDCCNPKSMGGITELIQAHLPGVFVHSVKLGDSINDDRNAGFFGIINDQVDSVCQQLANIPELANGFNAVGFSQGGLFMRAYVERCNLPPVRHLITFGSPHGGVSDIPNCIDIHDFKCTLMRTMVKRGVYTSYVQHHVVQAQYYKSSTDLQDYLDRNIFLPQINNQVEEKFKNNTYRDHLGNLETFVMIKFTEDTMIKPPESAWFWTLDKDNQIWPLEQQKLYQEDWLGLQFLEHNGRLKFLECPGLHMQISDEFFIKEVIQPYLADGARKHFVNQQL